MLRVLVGTQDGLHEFDLSGLPGAVQQATIHHPGREVTAVAPEGWELWTILDGAEVWHTAGVDWWFHVGTLDGLRGNCLADTRAGVIVGTSEAHLSRVAGEGLERVAAFDTVEGRSEWFTPWGGPPDTRSITEDGSAVYANVHVGGIVRSRDKGVTWTPTIDIHADVHRVCTGKGRVFAASSRGLEVSEDQGDSWIVRKDGLHATYCRAVAVCGENLLLSASAGPRGDRSAVYRGRLGGGAFERCRDGLPTWFDANIDSYCLDALPSGGLAVIGAEDGRVFASLNQGESWSLVASGLPQVRCVLALP
jgi:hypothetical protein